MVSAGSSELSAGAAGEPDQSPFGTVSQAEPAPSASGGRPRRAAIDFGSGIQRGNAWRRLDEVEDHDFGSRDLGGSDYARRVNLFRVSCLTQVVYEPEPAPGQTFGVTLRPHEAVDPTIMATSVLPIILPGQTRPLLKAVHGHILAPQAQAFAWLVGSRGTGAAPLALNLREVVVPIPSMAGFQPIFDYLYLKDLDRLRYQLLHPGQGDRPTNPPYPVPTFSDAAALTRLTSEYKDETVDRMVQRAKDAQRICWTVGFYDPKVLEVVSVATGLLVMAWQRSG